MFKWAGIQPFNNHWVELEILDNPGPIKIFMVSSYNNLMKKFTKFILAQHALANAFAMQSPEYGQALQQMGIQNPFSQGLPQVHLSPNFWFKSFLKLE